MIRGGIKLRLLAASIAALPVAGVPAAAQSPDEPIEIVAGEGLEWRRHDKMLSAGGGVVLTRGVVKLEADSVNAYYREDKDGNNQQIYRVDAAGSVRIASDGATGYGDSAAFDLDQSVFVLSGARPRLEAEQLKVTAGKNLEYWQARKLAVARGDAVAESDGTVIRADILSAYMREGGAGSADLRRVEAIGGVQISTAEDKATGSEAVYDAETGIATLCGNVEIRRGQNVLKGDCAELDLNSGVSRLLGGGGSVRGLVKPPE